MTDNEIVKALECCAVAFDCPDCPFECDCGSTQNLATAAIDLINSQKELIDGLVAGQKTLQKRIAEKDAEINKLNRENEVLLKLDKKLLNSQSKTFMENIEQRQEIERLKEEIKKTENMVNLTDKPLVEFKNEIIKEVAEKITEIFMRYAHLHSYAEDAKRDYIEAVDGTEIEMQSVWDVITLQKNGMAEYEEMSRLQKNIEIIEKERLLTELEKDFRLLVKELTEPKADTSVSLIDGHIEGV